MFVAFKMSSSTDNYREGGHLSAKLVRASESGPGKVMENVQSWGKMCYCLSYVTVCYMIDSMLMYIYSGSTKLEALISLDLYCIVVELLYRDSLENIALILYDAFINISVGI